MYGDIPGVVRAINGQLTAISGEQCTRYARTLLRRGCGGQGAEEVFNGAPLQSSRIVDVFVKFLESFLSVFVDIVHIVHPAPTSPSPEWLGEVVSLCGLSWSPSTKQTLIQFLEITSRIVDVFVKFLEPFLSVFVDIVHPAPTYPSPQDLVRSGSLMSFYMACMENLLRAINGQLTAINGEQCTAHPHLRSGLWRL